MKLFKFVAASGILSRRKSQESIKSALITVNDIVILDPFFEIDPKKDIVRLDQQIIKFNKEFSAAESETIAVRNSDDDPNRTMVERVFGNQTGPFQHPRKFCERCR